MTIKKITNTIEIINNLAPFLASSVSAKFQFLVIGPRELKLRYSYDKLNNITALEKRIDKTEIMKIFTYMSEISLEEPNLKQVDSQILQREVEQGKKLVFALRPGNSDDYLVITVRRMAFTEKVLPRVPKIYSDSELDEMLFFQLETVFNRIAPGSLRPVENLVNEITTSLAGKDNSAEIIARMYGLDRARFTPGAALVNYSLVIGEDRRFYWQSGDSFVKVRSFVPVVLKGLVSGEYAFLASADPLLANLAATDSQGFLHIDRREDRLTELNLWSAPESSQTAAEVFDLLAEMPKAEAAHTLEFALVMIALVPPAGGGSTISSSSEQSFDYKRQLTTSWARRYLGLKQSEEVDESHYLALKTGKSLLSVVTWLTEQWHKAPESYSELLIRLREKELPNFVNIN